MGRRGHGEPDQERHQFVSMEAQQDDSSAAPGPDGEVAPVRGWRGRPDDRRYAEGYTDGYRYAAAKTGQRPVLLDSTDLFRNLARTGYSDDPCGRPGCRGCSACTRAAAAASNRERYGSVDFPGLTGWREQDAA
jgi:hypothetical protein